HPGLVKFLHSIEITERCNTVEPCGSDWITEARGSRSNCLTGTSPRSSSPSLCGNSSIRAKLYGSVLYAMFSRKVLRVHLGIRHRIHSCSLRSGRHVKGAGASSAGMPFFAASANMGFIAFPHEEGTETNNDCGTGPGAILALRRRWPRWCGSDC